MTTLRDTGHYDGGDGCTVAVVIVNWNSTHLLCDCLSALFASRMESGNAIRDVVVVDNASTDDSIARAVAQHPTITIVSNEVNRGFAVACNQGAAAASDSDYLLFLNPDTQPQPGALSAAMSLLNSAAGRHVGICGVRLVDENLQTATPASRFPSLRTLIGDVLRLSRIAPRIFPPHLLTAQECEHSRVVDQVCGAFFLVRRSLFRTLHGFDERFFMYYEEVDLSYRAARLGWASWLVADAACYHEGGASSRSVPARRLLYNLRSRLQFAQKHFSTPHLLGIATVTLLIEPPLRVVRALAGGSWRSARDTIVGYAALVGWLIRTLVARNAVGNRSRP